MKLEKELMIDSIGRNSFVLKTSFYNESRIVFSKKKLKQWGIKPHLNVTGKTLIATLKSRHLKKNKSRGYLVDRKPDELLIKEISHKETSGWSYDPFIPTIWLNEKYTISLIGDRVIDQYNINLEITAKEYEELRKLPPQTVMKLDLRLKK